VNSRDPNINVLELVVEALGTLAEELVLVGGCAVGLLISDSARPPVRETVDVDMVAQVVSIPEYYRTSDRLKACGFNEASDDKNMCRWKKGALILDVLPSSESILGHSTNQWYPAAVETAQSAKLPSGLQIRLINAPLFLATKFEAFHSRGEGDYLRSHDMEDIVNLVDGRIEVLSEIIGSPASSFLREEFELLITDNAFLDVLPAYFPGDGVSQARVSVVLERMRKLAGL
jgi:predicted nucleotidyltransferase